MPDIKFPIKNQNQNPPEVLQGIVVENVFGVSAANVFSQEILRGFTCSLVGAISSSPILLRLIAGLEMIAANSSLAKCHQRMYM